MRDMCDQVTYRQKVPAPLDPTELSVDDSHALLNGLRTLFDQSSESEKTRLLTIAPIEWGRRKIATFFNCTEHQARAALELRDTEGILAFPTSWRGNEYIGRQTIEKVLEYYRRDGVSRPSPNKKDIVLINGAPVGKRVLEMTISQAFYTFSIENPTMKIGKSKFFALRPKEVKPESPHDVCVCIQHENMSLLINVRVISSKVKCCFPL